MLHMHMHVSSCKAAHISIEHPVLTTRQSLHGLAMLPALYDCIRTCDMLQNCHIPTVPFVKTSKCCTNRAPQIALLKTDRLFGSQINAEQNMAKIASSSGCQQAVRSLEVHYLLFSARISLRAHTRHTLHRNSAGNKDLSSTAPKQPQNTSS